jgi:ABC-type nitrate/sulfonate/bicarbonate transport system substrate-binding protein
MKTIKIALDWTPNTNHIGIFIAKELNYYQEVNLDVKVLNPADDNYEVTPGKKLELNSADFAIAPFETVISLNNKQNKVNAIAVFAILQEDISSIVTLKTSELERPKALENKIYASYKARYEDAIVQQMLKNDGGKGNLEISYPEKLGIWNTLVTAEADATWIFDNWEGIEAETNGIELNKFYLRDYKIPYGYSPIIPTKRENLQSNIEDYSNFIAATRRGYLFVKDNQEQAKSILEKYLSDTDKFKINIQKSIAYTIPYFGDEITCGTMKTNRVINFLNWLINHQLENEIILSQNLFTNELLKSYK